VVPQQPRFQQPGPTHRPNARLADRLVLPPASANTCFGYGASQSNQIVLSGWLFDVEQANVASAQLMASDTWTGG